MITVKELKEKLDEFDDNARITIEAITYLGKSITGVPESLDNVFETTKDKVVISGYDF